MPCYVKLQQRKISFALSDLETGMVYLDLRQNKIDFLLEHIQGMLFIGDLTMSNESSLMMP